MHKLPAFPMLLGGLQQYLFQHQLTMMYGHVGADGALPEMLDSRYCDGVIIEGAAMLNSDSQKELYRKAADLPMVWCFREHSDPEKQFDHVFYNNRATGRIAAEYLAGRGHRQVAYLSSSPVHNAFNERQLDFTSTCHDLGLEVEVFSEEVPAIGFTAEGYRRLTEKFLAAADRFTGVFFCADDTMLGVYNELRSLGYNCNHLDMIGCNYEELFLRYITPQPATIDIRLFEIGELAAQRLLQRINGIITGPSCELLVEPKLISGGRIRPHNHAAATLTSGRIK